MVYSLTSIDEVMGRVVRNTRVQDASYLLDASIWVTEAMGYMRTKVEVINLWKDVKIEFHVGHTPCGTLDIKAIEWNGKRLPRGNSSRTIDAPRTKSTIHKQFLFQQIFYVQQTPNDTIIYGDDAVPLRTCSCDEVGQLPTCEQYFITELGVIKTSFPDGCIRVHYTGIKLDENGFPAIPDNESYKQALYWYVRGQMIGAGWEDRIFRFDYCNAQFELYAARAMGQIRYPDVNSMEMKVHASTHLLPVPGYYEKFFFTPNQTF